MNRSPAQRTFIDDLRHGDGLIGTPVDRNDGTVAMVTESNPTAITVLHRDGTTTTETLLILTRAQAAAVLAKREGYDDLGHTSDDDLIAAANAPAGQPCADCGALVIWDETILDWQHVHVPTGCFLARRDER